MEGLFSLVCALALFLFGMALLGDGLQAQAGGRMERLLRRQSRGQGALLGFLVTAVLQSSSATTVLALGLADAGILTLAQVIPLIIGANVGTTVTAWLLCLQLSVGESPALAVLAVTGVVLYLFFPRQKTRGAILLGFFLLLTGMEQMTAAAAPLAEEGLFLRRLPVAAHPVLAVLAGALFTGVVQSSSASVGLLQALSSSGEISCEMAIPLILGQNIGTCVTALLASLGGGSIAKRAALSHLYFNVIGTAILLPLCFAAERAVPFLARPIDAVGIAIVHTAFNVLAAGILLPAAPYLEKLVTVGEKKKQKQRCCK